MNQRSFLLNALQDWVAFVAYRPRATLLVLLLITAAAGYVAFDRYSVNSRLGDLVEQEGGWREDYESFQTAFPQLVETAIVVVSGASAQRVGDAAIALEEAIAAQSSLFVDVYAPANETFFSDHAFLFMDIDQLDRISDQLAQAQPMLAAVSRDSSLRGVLELIVTGAAEPSTPGYARSVERLRQAAVDALEGRNTSIRWRDEFVGEASTDSGLSYRLIFLRGKQNYGATLPNAEIIAGLRSTISKVQADLGEPEARSEQVRVAVTGEIALRHDEVEAATNGVKRSGVVALVLLACVLALGVRSLRIVLATFAVLLMGSVWTAAWAMLAVGSFNTLSLVFLVMFFGLGVDFCVHYCLRVQEALSDGDFAVPEQEAPEQKEASRVLRRATVGVGGAIVLCTVTTAIGFLGFLPTPYKGLADLGVISAGGMVVACVLAFTLIPALFSAFGLPKQLSLQMSSGARVVAWLTRHRIGVFLAVGVLVGGCLWFLPRMQFDYSVLSLRDPSAESMRTLRELQEQDQITDYALYTLSPPAELSRQRALESLDSVERVITPLDYLPKDQEDKLYALESLQELLGGSLSPEPNQAPVSASELRESIAEVSRELNQVVAGLEATTAKHEIGELITQLDAMADASDSALFAWQSAVVDTLLVEIGWLNRATNVDEVEFDDLPSRLLARLVSPQGLYLSAVLPAEDITPVDALSRFVDTVRAEVESATGRPVVEWGVGNIVIGSFKTALFVALSGITLVLLIVLRSVRDALLVLTPLVLTALFTVATSVFFNVPVNMASVLVLPLIFGLGVDNGIHMVERYRASVADAKEPAETEGVEGFMQSSTPRAVLLSTLTTIGTFAALMLSPHAGTASIGFLLTVAIGYLLLFTVFFLPVLLSLSGGRLAGSRSQ